MVLVVALSSPVAAQSVFLSPLQLHAGGQTTLTMDVSRSLAGESGARQSLQQRHFFNLSGLSQGFVWKPWFSRLSLQFSSSFNYSQSNSRSDRARESSDSWNVANRLGAQLTLLPGSRMPFDLDLDASQVVSDQGAESWRYSIGIRQQFSPLARRSLMFDSSFDLDLDPHVTRQDFVFTVRDRVGSHDLGASFDWQQVRDDREPGSDDSYSLEGNHSVGLAARGVTITNFVSRIDSQMATNSGVVVDQFYNTVRWLPPLYLGRLDYRGTSRIVESEIRAAETVSSHSQLVHNSALAYRITPDLRVAGDLGLSYSDAGDLVSDESLSVDYSAPSRDWGVWTRSWNTGGTVGFAQGALENTEHASVSFDQRLSRDIERQGMARDRLDFTQGIDADLYDNGFDPIYTLSHALSFYRSDGGEESHSNWQLSGSDTREVNGNDVEVQLLRSDYRYSSFGWRDGALDSQLDAELFRRLDAGQAESLGVSVATLVRYSQSAILAISRLNYHAEARLDWLKNIKAAEGDAQEAVLTWRLSSELRWGWGLLSLSGILDFSGTREVADVGVRVEVRRQWRPLN